MRFAGNLLALDTAGHACSVAVINAQGQALFSQSKWMARGHAAALAPMTQAALDRCGPESITALAVTRGPGGFTGMRAGLAYARAFALARALPLLAFDCFTALRASVGPQLPCLIDSRRGDFFYDAPTAAALDLPLGAGEAYALVAPAALNLAEDLADRQVAGSIWRSAFGQQSLSDVPDRAGWVEPCPLKLAQLAQRALSEGQQQRWREATPLYIRPPSIG